MDPHQSALKRRTFETHIYQCLKEENAYADVTLVSDELIPFQAHKFVISACSEVLKELLIQNNHQHPIIYMRNITKHELEAFLRFLYFGKILLAKSEVEGFFKIATDLRVKHLIRFTKSNQLYEAIRYNVTLSKIGGSDVEKEEHKKEKVEKTEDIEVKPVIRDNGILSMYLSDIKAKIEKKVYKCPICESTYSHKFTMSEHMKSQHEGIRYPCKFCDFKTTTVRNLRKHHKFIHEGVKIYCDQCEYGAASKRHLDAHRESIHEGVKHFCDQCGHYASRIDNLREHIKVKHAKTKYSCDQCTYQTGSNRSFKKHLENKHT